MASFAIPWYFAALSFLFIYFKTLTADPNTSFSFNNFGKGSNFETQLVLYGGAKVVNNGLSVQITGPLISTAGRMIYKKPIKLVEGEPRKMLFFSTYFTFSLSPKNGNGLAFVMFPVGFPLNVFHNDSFGLLGEGKIRVFGFECDTSMDIKYGDVNGKCVCFNVDFRAVTVGIRNAYLNLVLNNGEKLQAWIDYEGGSRQLQVRLNQLGELRPVDPMVSLGIDLSQMFEEEVFLGLSSSSGNSSQECNVYSWSFKLRQVRHWMHSQPLDPHTSVEKTKDISIRKGSDCVSRILSALIFGIGCAGFSVFCCNLIINRSGVVLFTIVQCHELMIIKIQLQIWQLECRHPNISMSNDII